MTEDNFHLVGRALQQDYPEYFTYLAELVAQTESRALSDIDQLPALYHSFCILAGYSADPVKCSRQPTPVINQRRLFIAVAVYLYDPMYLNNYSGRMRDRLRNYMAAAMQCCPEWVSTAITSVRFEYQHNNTFQMQVNLIAYYLRQHTDRQAA